MTTPTPQSHPGTYLSGMNHPKTILFVLWLLLNTFILVHRGIELQWEAAKYIGQAHLFLETGAPLSNNFYFYIIQILLIAFSIKFHLGFFFVVLVQLFFNLLATAFFYKTVRYLFDDNQTAFVATLVLLANYCYHEFNTYLYTESLFYSFTLILSCYLIRIRTLSIKNTSAVIAMLFIVCITRPTGLLFLLPAFLYFFLVFFRNMSTWKKISILAGLSILSLFLLNLAIGSGGELDFMLPFRNEILICSYSTVDTPLSIKTAENGNSLYGLLFYITHNTSQFLRLAGIKSALFWGVYREWYSPFHNAYSIIYFWSLYIMTFTSLSYWVRNNPNVLCYLLAAIGLTWLTVALTCDDFHNRFYLTISPFLIILAMPTLQKLLRLRSKTS